MRIYYGLLVLSVVVYAGLRAIAPHAVRARAGGRSATTRCGWRRSASTCRCTARWRSPWPGSSPASPACSTSGGTARSTRPRSPSARRSTSSSSPSSAASGTSRAPGSARSCYVVANNYLRSLPLVDHIGITEARFNTVVGALVLLIVVLSPEGLSAHLRRPRSTACPRPPLGAPDTGHGRRASGALVIHQPTAHIQQGGTAMKTRTARRGTVVASVAVVGLTVGRRRVRRRRRPPGEHGTDRQRRRQRRADQARHRSPSAKASSAASTRTSSPASRWR